MKSMIPMDSTKLRGASNDDRDQVIRNWGDVSCEHAFECFNGCRYGKGCYEDELNSAMGGKPWQECRCMTKFEALTYGANPTGRDDDDQ
jgi:hypothetical protein